MKLTMALILCNAASIFCAAAAAFLAYQGREGWGWFLFAAIILHSTPSGGGS